MRGLALVQSKVRVRKLSEESFLTTWGTLPILSLGGGGKEKDCWLD